MKTLVKLLPIPLLATGAAAALIYNPLLSAPAALAANAATGSHHGALLHAFLEKRLAALGVTETQKRQLHNNLRDARPRVQPLAGRFVAEKRTLRGLMQSGTVDEAAIRAQVARVSAVGADLAVERARIAQNARAVLTPEQLDKIVQFQTHLDARIDTFIDHLFQQLD